MATQFFETVENPDLSKVTRILVPLSGDEVIEAIGEHLKSQLRATGKFLPQLIFEEVTWKGGVQVDWKGYSENISVLNFDGVKRESSSDLPPDSTPDPAIPPIPPVKESGATVAQVVMMDKQAPPDKIREVTGQAIPVLMRSGHSGSGGATVKVPADKLTGKGGK